MRGLILWGLGVLHWGLQPSVINNSHWTISEMNTAHFGKDIDNTDIPHPDPIELMQWWIPEGSDSSPRSIMSLATTGIDGYPNVRHVLASTCDKNGISFHTTTDSAKVEELQADPRAAVTIVWPQVGKQIIVQGEVERQSPEEASQVYHERSRYLQLLAHVNTVEVSRKPASERQDIWEKFVEDNPEGCDLSPPPSWVGYVLKPKRISFWRAMAGIPSNRHDYYRQEDGSWSVVVVPG